MTPKRPGPKRTFTLQDAVEAALALGVASFTLRGVARRLGVQPAALYRVCGSRDELQLLALEQVARTAFIQRLPVASWQEKVRQLVDMQWRMLEEHPEVGVVVNARADAFTAAAPSLRQGMEELVQLGIPGGFKTACFVVDFVGDLVFTTFAQMRPFREGGPEVRAQVAQALGELEGVFDVANMPERGWLDDKIDFIIAGVEKGLGPGGEPRKASPHGVE